MTAVKKTSLFILYILLTGAILLYILFPSDAVKDHIANRINRNINDLQVEIGTLRLVFPPAVLLRDVTVERDKNVLFFIDRLKLSPRWYSVIFAKKALTFRAEAYQGEISGRLSFTSNSKGAQVSASGTFSQMQLEQIPLIFVHSGDRLTGILSGDFQLDSISQQAAAGSGTFLISDCTFMSPISYMNLEHLSFQRIEADFNFSGNNFEIINAEMQGPELTGNASGTIFFASPISESRIDLEIEVTPLHSSTLSGINTLTFRASETFENPKVTIVPNE